MSDFAFTVAVFVGAVFVGMLVLFPLGRRLGRRHWQRNPKAADAGWGNFDAAMFALLGLLVAFTFSGAAERFNDRRALIADETTAIGTAFLRLDLLPASVQPELRADFLRYLDLRLAFYHALTDPERAKPLKQQAEALQLSIWSRAVTAAGSLNQPAPMMLVASALNAMIDISTTREMSLFQHPPKMIYLMLGLLCLLCALFGGFSTAPCEKASRLHAVTFAAVVAFTIYITLDLEYPRHGLIRVDPADRVLIELRHTMQDYRGPSALR